jgi:hypothetical protein
MPCTSLKFNIRFGRTCHFHLRGREISEARNQHEADSKMQWFIIRPWKCRRYESLVDLQQPSWRYVPKTELFITATVRSSNTVSWIEVQCSVVRPNCAVPLTAADSSSSTQILRARFLFQEFGTENNELLEEDRYLLHLLQAYSSNYAKITLQECESTTLFRNMT